MRIVLSVAMAMAVASITVAKRAAADPPVVPAVSAVPVALPAPAASPASTPAPLAPIPPIPPIPQAPHPPALVAPPDDGRNDLVGWHDGFFIRDRRDLFRLYPHLMAEIDFHSSFGPGVHPDTSKSNGQAPDVAQGLVPRIFINRVRTGFHAEFLHRWSVTALLEFGGQPVGDTSGTAETSAAKPGVTPTGTTGRYAAVQTVASAPYPADVVINYSACKCANLAVGQFYVPFSLDNRTGNDYYAMLDRPVAMRGFVVPSQRDIGVAAWGEIGPRVVNYEIGVFGGDGQNRPFVGGRVDGIGRVYVRPFAGHGGGDLEKYTQIGVSGRYGWRDQQNVAYDTQPLTSAQGFVFWKPTYTDSQGRLVHVIPSGKQGYVGGELRMQVDRVALIGEGYYVTNDTREALDGYQLTNTERLGRLYGAGWYAELSAWPWGDAFLSPERGVYRPKHLDLDGPSPSHMPRGLEVIALVSGINASYDGAGRLGSKADARTPMGDIDIYQLGLGANYWQTKHARVGIYYSAYITPGGGTSQNQAVVPSNLITERGASHVNTDIVLHELSARVALVL